MATYTPVWLGNTPDYESDAYIRLWIDGHSGNTNTEVQRIYISRWNQADNTWGADSRHDTQEFNYGSPGTTVANRLYRWRARGWRSDSGYSDYSYSNYVATTPRAPINQSAGLAGPNAINLSWADGCYEPYYPYETEIWWSVNGGAWGHYTTVAAGTTSYAFSGLTPGATYQFGVRHLETNNRNLPGGLSPTLGSAFAYTGTLTATNVPATPGAITATRNSDAQATLSWANNSNGGAPYDSLTLQRWDNVGNAWATIANLSGGATSATDSGLVAGRKYQWRIVANNVVGSSDWSYSGNVFTTPQAVGNAQGLYVGGTTIRATWANNVSYSEYSLRVQAYKNGVADGAVVTLGSGVTSYDKTSVTNTATYYFRIWAVSDVGALASSTVDTNTVQAAAAPNAPTGLAASPGSTLDKARTHSISWTHSPSTDGSAQTKYEIQHRLQGAGTWTAVTAVTSSTSSHSNPFSSYTNGQTVEWQVRTWGVHANPSPWSATNTVVTSTTPTVTITGPATTITTSQINAAWSYFDTESTAQAEWRVDLFDSYNNVIETKSGTGTTSSVTMATAATDGATYRIEVTVRDASGLWSDKGVKTFSAAFTPPAEVLLNAELDTVSGSGVLALTPTATTTPGTTLRVNRARNPRGISPDTYEYGSRFAWTRTFVTGDTSLPSNLGLSTFVRMTCPADQASASARGIDLYANIDTTPGTTGAAIAMSITAGNTVTTSAWVRSSVAVTITPFARFHDGAGAWLGTTVNGGGVVVPANTWTRVSVTIAAPTGTGGRYLAVSLRTSSTNTFPIGATMDFTAILVEESATVNDYFDGDTPRDSVAYHEWTGTANASASYKKRIGTIAASGVTVERQFYDPEAETWSEWETLIENAPPTARLIDTTAPAHDDGRYRITTLSTAPSSYRSSTLVKPPPIDNRWLYVSGGPNFEVVCKMWANIEIEQTASRAKALHYFAGRKNPVIYSGEMAERTYSVSGILEDEASNPNQWIRLARQAGPVLLRAPGRRMYGSLSEVSIERIQHNLHKVSFSIQEVSV